MISQHVKEQIMEMSRDLYNGKFPKNHILFCSNGIYKLAVAKPAPRYKNDRYSHLEMFEYNKYTKKWEYASSYGSPYPQDLSFELRDRFKL